MTDPRDVEAAREFLEGSIGLLEFGGIDIEYSVPVLADLLHAHAEQARNELDQEREGVITALHGMLQGAFALLTPEQSEELGITKAMCECERLDCNLLTGFIEHHRSQAREQERQACEEIVREACEEQIAAYPVDVFVPPPPGQHGATVDGCSAAALRAVLPILCDEILRRIRERSEVTK